MNLDEPTRTEAEKVAQRIIGHVGDDRSLTLAQFGIGDIATTMALADFYLGLIAVDGSREVLEQLHERCVAAGVSQPSRSRVKWELNDGSTPIGQAVDVVVALDLLKIEGLTQQCMVIANLAASLRRPGRLLLDLKVGMRSIGAWGERDLTILASLLLMTFTVEDRGWVVLEG